MRFIFLALLFMSTIVGFSQQQQQPTGITVTGEGIIKVTPDRVKIRARVEHKGQSATEVKSETDKAMKKVLAFLKKEKLSEKDYQTDYVSLNQNYDYNTKENYYQAAQSITITLNNPEDYSNIMTGLMKSGINRIDGVSFEDSKLEEHRKQARVKAIENAKTKAEDYAQTLGLKVGIAQMINESGNNSPAPRSMMLQSASFDSKMSEESSPLAVGQIEIKERVEVRFSIDLK